MIFQFVFFVAMHLFTNSVAKPWMENHYDGEVNRWSDAAFEFVRNLTCKDCFLTTEEDCWQLTSVQKGKMNFYSAVADPGEKLIAVLPDGPLTRSAAHDAVLVLDPYPEANLGHLLVVFFVNRGWGQMQCEVNGGHYIGDNTCLSLALRKRCQNMLLESKWKLKYLNKQYRNKLCEINFFPLVHGAGEVPSQQAQRLQCRNDIEGYAPCPELRPLNHTESLVCDPLQTNTQSCFLSGSSSDPTISTRCRLFERCDHAVLISGGWDRLTDRPLYKKNLLTIQKMLEDNGFPNGNVKMFYSNGKMGQEDLESEDLEVYPSALKLHFRYHLRKLCQSVHCADSVVLYLSGPTMSDGTMLLWDIDGNGQSDENEVYTIKELLHDTRDCVAQQVYIIADQSYSGMIINALENSQRHENVMAFASGTDLEYSWNGEFTKHWKSFSSGLQKPDICVGRSFEAVREYMNSSLPLFFDGSKGNINTTLFGAPCDVRPPYTEQELRRFYLGCQNLPTSVWLRRRKSTYDEVDYE